MSTALTISHLQAAAKHLADAFERFSAARVSDEQAHAHRARLIGHLEAAEAANAKARTEVVTAHHREMRNAIEQLVEQTIAASVADVAIVEALRQMSACFRPSAPASEVLQ